VLQAVAAVRDPLLQNISSYTKQIFCTFIPVFKLTTRQQGKEAKERKKERK
jgi:hypothetical protein